MKKLILILAIIPLFFNAQNYKFTYELTYKAQKDNDSITKELFDLIIIENEKKSYFYSYSKTISDSLYKVLNKSTDIERKKILNLIPNYSYKSIIEKNSLTGNMKVYEKFDNQYYFYYQNSSFKYDLRGDTKIILGYVCRRAIVNFGQRTWNIWYSEELPFHDGPFKFSGLPGLILEAGSIDDNFIFKITAISKTLSIPGIPKNIIKVKTQNELIELKRKYVKNPSAKARLDDFSLNNVGNSIINGKKYSPEESYKLIDNELWDWMKKNNNPIEKYDILVL